MFYFVYEWSKTLCGYWKYLIDCNAQKKVTGSTLRVSNLASSIEITYMMVAHKMYHIILAGSEKTILWEPQFRFMMWLIESNILICKVHLYSNVCTRAKRSNRITLTCEIHRPQRRLIRTWLAQQEWYFLLIGDLYFSKTEQVSKTESELLSLMVPGQKNYRYEWQDRGPAEPV